MRRPDVPIVGDCKYVIAEIIKADQATCSPAAPTQADTAAWKSRISGWREQFPLTYEPSEPGEALKPQFCLEKLRDAAPEGTILASGVGQHQMWSSQYWKFNEPYTWVNSGGLGTMGFSIPAAIGAKVGRPDRTVWADRRRRLLPDDGPGAGDGVGRADPDQGRRCSTTATSAWSASGRRCSTTSATARCTCRRTRPTTCMWAEAMGCVGIRVESPEEVEPAIEKANSINDRPVVVEFRVDCRREGVPDGARRPEQRRPRPAARARWPQGSAAMSERSSTPSTARDPADASGREPVAWAGVDGRAAPHRVPDAEVGRHERHSTRSSTTSCRCSSRTARACSPAWPGCSPGAGSTSSRSPSRRPSTRG